MNASIAPFQVSADEAHQTIAAILRSRLPGCSWSQIRSLIANRRATIRGELCLDPARRVKEGETLELLAKPAPPPRQSSAVILRHVDDQVVVVEKPAGLNSVRHPSELKWKTERKELSPTLHDVTYKLLSERGYGSKRLRIVHRLDKDTSGLLVFARSVVAERNLGKQFHAHVVLRKYVAIVPGTVVDQRIESRLVRDRGDGRRGSTTVAGLGKLAITHVTVRERLPSHSLIECRLETGRTHQIRIHLAELGHPICGDRVYCHQPDGSVLPDRSGLTRLALHAAELGFVHPETNEKMHWVSAMPVELESFLVRIRRGG